MLKALKGYEGKYSINSDGRVFSHHSNKYLKPAKHKDVRYFHVSLWSNGFGSSFYVHRLVALTWIPNPNNLPEVNHKDGDVWNNKDTNLEWVTSSENSIHVVNLGLRVYTNRLSFGEFQECLQSVIDGESYLSLTQRVPYKVPYLSTKLREIARYTNREKELNFSLLIQKQERARSNGAKNQ
jgi:hypothetical protein